MIPIKLVSVVALVCLLLAMPAASSTAPEASQEPVPPCAASSLVVAGSGFDGEVACDGLVTCPADAPAPCHWNVEAEIRGAGLVNVFVESAPEFNRCATLPTLLACVAHVHFQHLPGTVRSWVCGVDSTTTAALVELSCTATFDGFR